jgi:uncharacterized membrane protein YfcA
VPALLLLHLAGIKQAAACGGGFILCNSAVGLWAKWQTQIIPFTFEELAPYLVAVAIGGILGIAVLNKPKESAYSAKTTPMGGDNCLPVIGKKNFLSGL